MMHLNIKVFLLVYSYVVYAEWLLPGLQPVLPGVKELRPLDTGTLPPGGGGRAAVIEWPAP